MISDNKWYMTYPNIPIEIVKFFKMESKDGIIVDKDIMMFCSHYKKKYKLDHIPRPQIVLKICNLLVQHGKLEFIKSAGYGNMNSVYLSILNEPVFEHYEKLFSISLDCLVYGYHYIFNTFKEHIVPILHITQDGDETIGTGFYFQGGIVTAKHCIENAKEIAIRGVSKEDLKKSKVFIHANSMMDIAFISFDSNKHSKIELYDEADVLDEVMAIGYPQIPGFHNFLTVEKANIASRLTASSGQVAGYGKDIWIKEDLLLITAKIKGGNSGGPILRNDGYLIGVTSQKPHSEGNYDDLGYGTVIPIKYVMETINAETVMDLSKIEFKGFPEND